MQALPKSMVVIGGGVIGSEYAGLFAALSIDVSLVHQGDRVLSFLDFEIIDASQPAPHIFAELQRRISGLNLKKVRKIMPLPARTRSRVRAS